MSETILSATGIAMSYRGNPVLQGATLRVKQGEVCGLLGPNGAGKTTLLKIITGLTRPDAGDVELFGKPFAQRSLRETGAIIEKPVYYGGKTTRENLQIHQELLGIPEDRVKFLLEQVGLADAADKRAAKLSTGMKQRLAIAMALMGRPRLLLLDEPVNSLDTQGMYDMRALFQELNRDTGTTIVITSHLLDEVSRLATSYAILRDGVIFQYSAEEVRGKSRQYAEIITGNPRGAVVVLDRFVHGEGGYEVRNDGAIHLFQGLDRLPEINAALVESAVAVESLSLKTGTLAEFYLDETGRGRS